LATGPSTRSRSDVDFTWLSLEEASTRSAHRCMQLRLAFGAEKMSHKQDLFTCFSFFWFLPWSTAFLFSRPCCHAIWYFASHSVQSSNTRKERSRVIFLSYRGQNVGSGHKFSGIFTYMHLCQRCEGQALNISQASGCTQSNLALAKLLGPLSCPLSSRGGVESASPFASLQSR
jgi:hypothetical protein